MANNGPLEVTSPRVAITNCAFTGNLETKAREKAEDIDEFLQGT